MRNAPRRLFLVPQFKKQNPQQHYRRSNAETAIAMTSCSILGFSSSLPLLQSALRTTASRSNIVCELDPAKSARIGPVPTEAKTKNAKKVQTSLFYEVLPDGTTEEGLQRTPRHKNLPVIGFFIDNWLGKTPGVLAAKYGKAYRTRFMTYSSRLIVTDMDAITDIERNVDLFRSANAFDSFEAVFGEKSMFVTDGREHAMLRNTVAPAFSPNVYPFFFDKIRGRVEKTWDAVKQEVVDKGKVLLDPIFRRHYLSIIVEMTTGIDMDSEMSSILVPRFFQIAKTFFSPTFGPIYDNAMKARAEVIAILEDIIKRNVQEEKQLIEKLREYGDNLSFKGSRDIKKGEVNVLLIAIAQSGIDLTKDPNAYPDELRQLSETMLLLWFAGYTTSAATTSCAAFEVGFDDAIWAQLAAEQDAIMQSAEADDVTYDQVRSEMPLLDSYINEILRMHPAAPGALRIVTDDVSILGNHVQKGEIVFLDYAAAMRNPYLYADPDRLMMDRFVRREGEKPATRVISFGPPGSPHHCLGEALSKILMRTTLAVLLRKYTMELDPKQSRKYAVVPDDTPKSKVVVRRLARRG